MPPANPSSAWSASFLSSSPTSQSQALLDHAHGGPRSRWLPRCTLRLIFVVCSIVQVAVACVVLWVIGYSSQLSIVSSLSGQLRQQTLSHAVDQVSELLSVPVLASAALDHSLRLRSVYTATVNAATEFDFSQDPELYTILGNLIREYPGVTAVGVMNEAGAELVAIIDTDIDPPPLAFVQQDARNAWNSTAFFLSDFNQTLTTEQLYSGEYTGDFFFLLSQQQLDAGRAQPLSSSHYVAPNATQFYNVCHVNAQQQILANDNATIANLASVWILQQNVSHTGDLSVSVSLQICRAGVNWTPNATQLLESAAAAEAAGSPQAGFLYRQAELVAASSAQNLTTPIVEFVSVVTYNAYAMSSFLMAKLNSYVVDSGAAFIVTSDYYMIASSQQPNEIALMIYLPTFFADPLPASTAALQAQYPQQLGYLEALYSQLQSMQASINLTAEAQPGTSDAYEAQREVNGVNQYVQYSVLQTPASFQWILVMYSPVSDYSGTLHQNIVISGVISAVVLVVSVFVTLFLTHFVHGPIVDLVDAMRHLANVHRKPSAQEVALAAANAKPPPPAPSPPRRANVSDPPMPPPLAGRVFIDPLGESVTHSERTASPDDEKKHPPEELLLEADLGAGAVSRIGPSVAPTVREESRSHGSESSAADDISSFELDRLLHKWKGTMARQGLPTPSEWEASAEMRAEWEVERQQAILRRRQRLKGVSQKSETALRDSDKPSPTHGSDADSGCWPGLRKSRQRDPPRPSPELSKTPSGRSTGSSASDATASQDARGWPCPPGQRRGSRLLDCIGSFMEVVQLEMTFGWLLVRLRNSQIKLEKANQAKRQFLRFVFHEVRVPLNALGLAVEELGDAVAQSRGHAAAAAVSPSAERTDALGVDDLLVVVKDNVTTVARILNESAPPRTHSLAWPSTAAPAPFSLCSAPRVVRCAAQCAVAAAHRGQRAGAGVLGVLCASDGLQRAPQLPERVQSEAAAGDGGVRGDGAACVGCCGHGDHRRVLRHRRARAQRGGGVVRAGRPVPDPAGGGQLHLQRRQVLPGVRAHPRGRAAVPLHRRLGRRRRRLRPGWGRGADGVRVVRRRRRGVGLLLAALVGLAGVLRHGRGLRHRRAQPADAVPAVHADPAGRAAGGEGLGPGPQHRQAPRGAARRLHTRQQRPGQGQRLLLRHPRPRGARREEGHGQSRGAHGRLGQRREGPAGHGHPHGLRGEEGGGRRRRRGSRRSQRRPAAPDGVRGRQPLRCAAADLLSVVAAGLPRIAHLAGPPQQLRQCNHRHHGDVQVRGPPLLPRQRRHLPHRLPLAHRCHPGRYSEPRGRPHRLGARRAARGRGEPGCGLAAPLCARWWWRTALSTASCCA